MVKQATEIVANRVVIKSIKTQKYVCANKSGSQSMNCNGESGKTEWEKFEMKRFDGNKRIALLSSATNKYVCAPPNGTSLIANKSTCDKWEFFELVSLEDGKIAIIASFTGKYLSVRGKRNVILANASRIGLEEQFIIVYN
jgi:hypothetical protein